MFLVSLQLSLRSLLKCYVENEDAVAVVAAPTSDAPTASVY